VLRAPLGVVSGNPQRSGVELAAQVRGVDTLSDRQWADTTSSTGMSASPSHQVARAVQSYENDRPHETALIFGRPGGLRRHNFRERRPGAKAVWQCRIRAAHAGIRAHRPSRGAPNAQTALISDGAYAIDDGRLSRRRQAGEVIPASRLGRGCAVGRTRRNSLPRPGVLSSSMCPPRLWAARWAIASPSPEPPVARLRALSTR
jgi:hypothetical protein